MHLDATGVMLTGGVWGVTRQTDEGASIRAHSCSSGSRAAQQQKSSSSIRDCEGPRGPEAMSLAPAALKADAMLLLGKPWCHCCSRIAPLHICACRHSCATGNWVSLAVSAGMGGEPPARQLHACTTVLEPFAACMLSRSWTGSATSLPFQHTSAGLEVPDPIRLLCQLWVRPPLAAVPMPGSTTQA